MQYENLNKGRATGPCVTVDAVDTDEGAICAAGLQFVPTSMKTDYRALVDREATDSSHLYKASVV